MTTTYYQIRTTDDSNEENWTWIDAESLPQTLTELEGGNYQLRGVGASEWSESIEVTGGVDLREQIEGLRYRQTPNGVPDIVVLKVPGVDSLPTGASYNAGTSLVTISSGFSGDLEGWDFTGLMLVVQGSIDTIRHCRFGESYHDPAGRLYYLNCYVGGSIDTIEYCTFEGPYTFGGSGTAVNIRGSGSGVEYSSGNIRRLRYNRFIGLGSDHIKTNGSPADGGQIIEWNYFGATVNLPNVPGDYDEGETYAEGVAVRRVGDGWVYISKIEDNTGNPLPDSSEGKTGQNDWWSGADPHADSITTVAAIGDGITIRRNLFDHTFNPPGEFGPYPGIGLTNALRLSRNTGTDHLYNRVTCEENVVFRAPGEGASPPIQVSAGVKTNFNGPVEFIGNWLSPSAGGSYFHPSSNDWVDVWSENRDYQNDELIMGPTLRPPSSFVVAFLGQSNVEYIMASTPVYNPVDVSRPTILDENAIYIGANPGAPDTIIERPVSAANVTDRQVNVAMAVWSQWLSYIAPDTKWVFLDLAEAGTGRAQIMDDANSNRDWTNTAALVAYAEENYHAPDLVVEWWYANDAASLDDFTNEWAPFYLGQRGNGSQFMLGNTNPDSNRNPTATVDHCLWDIEAAPHEKGRGLFTRDTKWTYVKNHWKDSTEARLAGIGAFHADERVQTFAEPVGAWGILYANDGGHALVDDPDGQVYLAWTFAPSLARLAGVTIHEPTIFGMEVAEGGTYADIIVDLPNGGTLSTIRMLEERAAPDTPLPHQQPVSGFEIRRWGDSEAQRQPVFLPSETDYPAKFRGTVSIQDTGSGDPKRGVIRITPVEPFEIGDQIYPLWMGVTDPVTPGADPYNANSTASKIWLDYPIEHISTLVDNEALYKYPGIAVAPFSEPLIISSGEASWNPNWVTVGSDEYLYRHMSDGAIANTTGMTFAIMFQNRLGGINTRFFNIHQRIVLNSVTINGPLRISIRNTSNVIIWECVTDVNFSNDTMYNLVVSFDGGANPQGQIYVNGVSVAFTNSTAPTSGTVSFSRNADAVLLAGNSAGSSSMSGDVAYIGLINEFTDLAEHIGEFWADGNPVNPEEFLDWNVWFGGSMTAEDWNEGDGLGTVGDWIVEGEFTDVS
ncbi:MAG: hypothetical protein WCY93_10495 [Anaerolineaceae bacterium]